MALTNEEKMKAIRISRALEEYLKMTGKTNMRSTEVYEYLARKGLVERDRHQGVYFRKFLNKLKRENALDLIPQCTAIDKNDRFTNWYFHAAPEKMSKTIIVKQVTEERKPYGKVDALPVLKKVVAGLNPTTGGLLEDDHLFNDMAVRKAIWFAIETIEGSQILKENNKTKKRSVITVVKAPVSTSTTNKISNDHIFESEINEVKSVLLSQSINPTPSRVASLGQYDLRIIIPICMSYMGNTKVFIESHI